MYAVEAYNNTIVLDDRSQQELTSPDKSLRVFSPTGQVSSEAAALADGYLDIRHEFVQRMGWLPDTGSDVDEYDTNPATSYVLRTDLDNVTQVQGGLRLTKVEDMDAALSWRMLNRNWEMQAAAADNEPAMRRINRAVEQGTLWDLTRLILPSNRTAGEVVLDLVGGGIAATTSEALPDSSWLFLATTAMKKGLDGLGIKSHLIISGLVSRGDTDVSHLCVASTAETLEYTGNSPLPREQHTYQRLVQAQNLL